MEGSEQLGLFKMIDSAWRTWHWAQSHLIPVLVFAFLKTLPWGLLRGAYSVTRPSISPNAWLLQVKAWHPSSSWLYLSSCSYPNITQPVLTWASPGSPTGLCNLTTIGNSAKSVSAISQWWMFASRADVKENHREGFLCGKERKHVV